MPETSDWAKANQAKAKRDHRIESNRIDLEVWQQASRMPIELITQAVPFEPGSYEKIVTLAARYERGVPLWIEGDERRVSHV